MTPKQKAEQFRALHVTGQPLVLFNIWDPGSAKAVAQAGARAIATGSWSVANANGYPDGERMPIDAVIDNLKRIVEAVDLPVTIDLESGYGQTPDEVGQAIARTVVAGAIGCNLEDSFPENGSLREIADQVERIRAARKAAGGSYFINLRTDVFFQPSQPHNDEAVEKTLARAKVYAEAGADGLFVPGVTEERLIGRLASESPLPVNVMVVEKTPPLVKLKQLGVARVSHGPGPWLVVMKTLEDAARAAAMAA